MSYAIQETMKHWYLGLYEDERSKQLLGRDWGWTSLPEEIHHFATAEEAQAWIDEHGGPEKITPASRCTVRVVLRESDENKS
jgi:hypothetical protein